MRHWKWEEDKFLKRFMVGEDVLKERFLRLFSLSSNKEGRLFQGGEWINNKWVWKAKWRRNLFV